MHVTLFQKALSKKTVEPERKPKPTRGPPPPTMSSTLKPGDLGPDAVEKARVFLGEIGLAPILAKGVGQMLRACPRPSSLLEALVLLSAQITQAIQAQDGGESKDAGTVSIPVFVKELVRARVSRIREALLEGRDE